VLFLAFSAIEATGEETMLRRLHLHQDGTIAVIRAIASFL